MISSDAGELAGRAAPFPIIGPPRPEDVGGASGEVELVRRVQGGDREAFAELYEDYAKMVHGILITMVPPQEAGDLVQDVFLAALRGVGGLERQARFGPWLATITRNRARDLHRTRGKEVELDEAVEPADEHPFAAGADEEAGRVLAVLGELPEAYRETLSLRLVEGLAGPEIAHRTGLTHGSVRVNLHRGMKLLRERLAALGWQGDIQ